MTAIELKATLLDNIQEINDVNLIKKISAYVMRVVGESESNKINKKDLAVNPIALDIVKNLKGGQAIDDKRAIHKHWEEKYK